MKRFHWHQGLSGLATPAPSAHPAARRGWAFAQAYRVRYQLSARDPALDHLTLARRRLCALRRSRRCTAQARRGAERAPEDWVIALLLCLGALAWVSTAEWLLLRR